MDIDNPSINSGTATTQSQSDNSTKVATTAYVDGFIGSTTIATVGTVTTGTWEATTIAVGFGGTGQTSYTNGQLLIGNTTGNTLDKATLTGTSNQVTVTNGGGSITLSTPQDIATSSTPTFGDVIVFHEGASTVNPAFTVVGSTSGFGVNAELTMQSSDTGAGTDTDYHISRNSRFQTSDDTYRRIDSTEGSAQILFNGSNDICFRVNSGTGTGAITYSDAVTILNNANVGINISPTETLHCDGTFRVGDASTFSDIKMVGNNFHVNNDAGGDIRINISGSTVMRIDSDTRVSIGDNVDSTNTLHVRTADSDSGGINIDRNASTNGDFIGVKFKIATTAGTNRYKAGILFERTGGNGVGSLHLVNDINGNDNNANLADAVITIDSSANVGIGTVSPAASAKVEISTTTGALLLSRMTTTQRDALTAVNGMIIYNSTNGVIEGYEGGAWANL